GGDPRAVLTANFHLHRFSLSACFSVLCCTARCPLRRLPIPNAQARPSAPWVEVCGSRRRPIVNAGSDRPCSGPITDACPEN
ncbi:hypothetical protein CW304_33085, partial [Bacillus sp. UFRGS-B20]